MTDTPDQKSRSLVKITIQLVGFGLGLAMLGWCAREALKPGNREQLAKLGEAGAGPVLLIFACSLLTLLINGLIFWVLLLPERRLKISDTLATNAFTTMLSYLPFKISVVARVALHNRREGVPVLLIASWFGAVGAVILVSLGPVSLASLWRKGVDPLWWIASGGGVIFCTGGLLLVAGLFAGDRGLSRVHAIADRLKLGVLDRFVRTDSFKHLHAIFGMLAHPPAVIGATLLRLSDIGVLTVRFMVAAAIVGVSLEWEQGVLFASTFFMIGLISPFGMLGTREAGSLGVAGLLGFSGAGESLAVVVLVVSATESLVYLLAGVAGGVWIRPDRLLRAAKAAAPAE